MMIPCAVCAKSGDRGCPKHPLTTCHICGTTYVDNGDSYPPYGPAHSASACNDRVRENQERLMRLNETVTVAILEAERLEAGSAKAKRAYRVVSELEEEIATCASAQSTPGQIARLGAVSAAIRAGDRPRVVRLFTRYLNEPLGLAPRAMTLLKQLVAGSEDRT